MAGKVIPALATALLTVVLIGAAAAFFASRDDATVPRSASSEPGLARGANTDPNVAPGNVVLLFSDERLTRELRELAERTAGPPDPALVAAGQAVVVERRPNLKVPVTAVTATRRLEAAGPSDPKLEGFIEHWLGRAR